MRVFTAAALPGKRIAAATTDNGINMIKGMKDGRIGRWPCAAAHMLNRVIKNTMNRVENNNSVDLLPRGLKGNVKFSPALQKEMERKEGSRRSMTVQRDKVCWVTYLCVCQGHLREEVEQAVCDKRGNQKRLLLEVTSSPRKNKDHTDEHSS